jgi:hypothetical protein
MNRMNYEGFEEYDPTVLGESTGKGCFFMFILMIGFFSLALILECSS